MPENKKIDVTILDPGMGNIRSVSKAFSSLGARVRVTQEAKDIQSAQRLVVPGVGAFGDCMKNLRQYKVRDEVFKAAERALAGKTGHGFLGICLGLQILFDESEEFGPHPGLGVFKGRVVRLPDEPGQKIPHMGWSEISLRAGPSANPLWQAVDAGAQTPAFYFVHSYVVVPDDSSIVAADCAYSSRTRFVAAVERGRLLAVQFHPEKSQTAGLRLLQNFLHWN